MSESEPADLEKFREQTRAWLEANCPPEMRKPVTSDSDVFWGGRNTKFASEPQRLWFERMRDKGWTVPDWPKEYGGGGLSAAEHKVLRAEMAQDGRRVRRCRASASGCWGRCCWNTATRSRRRSTCRRSRAGEIRWCQGYSEPDAGSDLASLQHPRRGRGRPFRRQRPEDLDDLRRLGRLDLLPRPHRPDGEEARRHQLHAVRHGLEGRDDQADPADLRLFAVLRNLLRRCPRAEVALVGNVNRGWDVAKYLLQHERAMISGMGERGVGRPLGQIAADCRRHRCSRPARRSDAARRIASFDVDERARRLRRARRRSRQGRPGASGVLVGDEILRHRARTSAATRS